MRTYFLSELPAALFLDGALLGTIDGFERSIELDPKRGVFCECIPEGRVPLRFRFDEAFLLAPPPQIRLYRSGAAAAVYCHDFAYADPAVRVLRQERIGGTLFTFFVQGRLQLSLDNETGFHLLSLPETFSSCTVREYEGFLLQGQGAFLWLDRAGGRKLLSEGTVLRAEEALEAEIDFHDSAGHTARCEWREGRMTSCVIRARREPNEATVALALFESALIGADCTPYLSPALQEKTGSLKKFLGDYTSVVLTGECDRVGLVYPQGERVFEVRYFRVSLEAGRVSNILPL